ncbi:mediator complex subunit 13 C-terminal-domain-containing protein [Xylariomycetidae sp. FL2044]|nr:mediator complex subunit 13 C-terminal-domain-containing protein [Xylariomycetidae sp. FL2044]
MDTGEYVTNALVINNISSVTFAFYEPTSPLSSPFGSCALEIESSLRKDGYLVHVDTIRRGIWCFRMSQQDKSQAVSSSEGHTFPKTVESGGYTLSLAEEGGFEPGGLVKSRPFGPYAANTPSSSSPGGSASLDPVFRSAQSATLPSFPNAPVEQDPRILTPTDTRLSYTTSIKDAYEGFISASLSAISAGFCAKTGAVALSSRTILLHRADERGCNSLPAILASLRLYLTTSGSLVITLSLSPVEGLICLAESLSYQLPPLGVTVLTAPLGVFANCQPIATTDTSAHEGSLGQSPDTQFLRLRTDRDDGPWRSICSKLVQSRGLPTPLSGSMKWISLQRMRRKLTEQSVDGKRTPMAPTMPSISWPASLCYCKMFSELSIRGAPKESASSHLEEDFDPLKTAKAWFLDAHQRDETLLKKERERAAAVATAKSLKDGPVQASSGLSPLALRRSSNPGPPLGGMYPTPPDGVPNPVGITPSIDGTLSSPGHNATASAIVDVDVAPNTSTSETYGANWDNPEAKRERMATSFESENLFGELGPDMFGDTDITEADFNFFDEDPGGMDLSSLGYSNISNADANGRVDLATAAEQPAQEKPEPSDGPAPDAPSSPLFTKPELRHARSSLGEEGRRYTVPERSRPQFTGFKREASPFNPDTVYKRIRASLDNHKAVQHNSLINISPHGSIFEKVDFGPGLSMVNSKYQGSGRFDYSADRSKNIKPASLNEPPTTTYLQRHGKTRKGLKELPAQIGERFARISGVQDSASNRPSPPNAEDAQSDADDISLVSDQDDSSVDSEEIMSPVKSVSLKRRAVDDDGESLATSFRELETMDVVSPYLPLELPRSTKFEADLPLSRYFEDPEPPWIHYSLPDDQLIMAAQILTAQFASSTLCTGVASQAPVRSRLEQRREISTMTRNSLQDLQSVIPSYLGYTSEYQFRPFIEIQDVPLLGQPTRMQPRPPGAEQMRPSNLFQFPSPHFEVRRYESKLSVLPSAVPFWESLGLSPCPGNKDINAVCIFPELDGLADDMLVFTDRMRSIYESLKLGSFNRLQTSAVENGLFTFEIEKDLVPSGKSSSFLGPSLQSCASKVCKMLSSMMVEKMNFVIFFFYTPDVVGSVVECCAAFNEIFEGYKKILSNKRIPIVNELALQLVPQDLIASSSSIAMPSPSELIKLAIETYDRCVDFGSSMPLPAIVLEQQPPRMIDFKLALNPSASLLHENSCLHVAYAQSVDERWVTTAWTDNRGSQQVTASYCLGRKGKSISTSLTDVQHEIWATTRELISSLKVHWRIIIAKCGIMDQQEIEVWSALAQAESKASTTLVLITVDTDPSMQLIPPAARIPSNAPSVFYTTPVSTPQGSMVSPEQSGNPSTPMRDNTTTSVPTPGGDNPNATESDADATLTDLTDQTWGAVLSHRLNNSTSLTDLNPALVSGYLVKRGGARAEDPPAIMEINIVHSEGNPRAYEQLLREMLTYYRGLGTLARARGMVDKETDVRPWHIAAAEKAVRALYMLM